MPQIQTIYMSSASQDFGQVDIEQILAKSRENNAREDITGMLLYNAGNFIQVLEGEEASILRVMRRIERDPRHRGILKVMERRTEEREFGEWSMGYVGPGQASAELEAGLTDFLSCAQQDEVFEASGSQARKLLLSFKRSTGR